LKKKDSNINYKSLPVDSLSTGVLHQYLLTAIAPRPIAFASTMDLDGNVNLSPFSFFNVFGANPPLMIFSPARRVRDNTTKHTLENVKNHPEVVINMVDFAIVEQMSLSSTEYEEGINEFVKSGLTQVDGELVKVPHVGESPICFECKVEQVIETGDEGGAGNLVICRVLNVIVNEGFLDDKGTLDPLKLDLVGRMGKSWYVRASKDALFEIPKPIATKGIGVDQLPLSARNSNVLTGNNLGRLGNMEELPGEEEILQLKKELERKGFFKNNQADLLDVLHTEAQTLLEAGRNREALSILWLADKVISVE